MNTRNRQTRLLLAASATALLASCATMDDDRYAAVEPGYDARMANDTAYMAAVETLARGRGVDVTWVNPPKIRVEDDD